MKAPVPFTVAIQPEVYYSQRKYQYSPPDWYDMKGETYYDTVGFIELPILLKYKVKLRGDFKPVFFGGGYASFRLSRGEVKDWPYSFFLSRRLYANVDGGLVVGAGFKYIEGKVGYHLDLRYNFGLVDVQEVTPYLIEILVPPEYSKNRSLTLMVGISF
ncbi:MAG: outer membrane beta-barrel protein, partial [Candidatus Aminicenantes bacterium]|nr:outer membrane beta-barrel protein [Candidatus Aminicenantes bacterium]NIM82571.1 outer membrane beta-barrel protein [Candidatus Aminicenantes bacterium]NIN21931.1 outer membrane beta-barrel protein [Candidatus Aminicenantes bacterium]NIN45709.1 outer membrane beta-barrel protein [Candidatus Aminicenantes bacterium]NIN88544.1 outer membrane beta-barrel protein [Candidatus Aminicenantes bacterium]